MVQEVRVHPRNEKGVVPVELFGNLASILDMAQNRNTMLIMLVAGGRNHGRSTWVLAA